MTIRKAIFPVAGLGTRFLPATKAMPKEMLTVVDRPIIQHVVDEAREAGIEHFIFVTGRNKSVIEDHFDRQLELELTLTERGKSSELELLSRDLPGPGTTSFTRQQSPLGLGHRKGKAFTVTQMVEKPPSGSSPSNLIITGRYILQPEIFDLLATQEHGTGGEIQITDAMIRLAENLPFYGLKFEGRTFDCGSKIGFLSANVAYALAREDIAPAFRAEIEGLLSNK